MSRPETPTPGRQPKPVPAGQQEPTTASSPAPRRWGRPRWLNVRVVVGLLLVVGSVVAGVRLTAAAQDTVEVWAVRADLAAGAVLAADDLVPQQVRLADAAGRYLETGGLSPAGQVLGRPVGAGELLPAGALGSAGDQRVVVLPIEPDRLPYGLDRGSLVDIYAVTAAAATQQEPGARLLLEKIPVTGLGGTGTGLAASGSAQVSVTVSAADAQLLMTAMAEGRLQLALVTG